MKRDTIRAVVILPKQEPKEFTGNKVAELVDFITQRHKKVNQRIQVRMFDIPSGGLLQIWDFNPLRRYQRRFERPRASVQG